MDEEDGRPGSEARKSGPSSVPTDAVTRSLRSTLCDRATTASFVNHPYSQNATPTIRTRELRVCFIGAQGFCLQPQVEENYENVSGK
jgi:hypothetical protein